MTDVDRATDFYANQVGFVVDRVHTVSDEIRFVQLTPPGSACSIAFGSRGHASWGRLVFFSDPDGNGWAVQEIQRSA